MHVVSAVGMGMNNFELNCMLVKTKSWIFTARCLEMGNHDRKHQYHHHHIAYSHDHFHLLWKNHQSRNHSDKPRIDSIQLLPKSK